MGIDLTLSPSGSLLLVETEFPEGGHESAGVCSPVVQDAFGRSMEEGLFVLAADKSARGMSAVMSYWREFGALYLNALCHTPDAEYFSTELLSYPDKTELQRMVLSVPPMVGAEYIGVDVLRALWMRLDSWVRSQLQVELHAVAHSKSSGESPRESSGDSLSKEGAIARFLKTRAPLWHQVGRVCFHLAENKKDTDYPFAFLVTYIPRIAGNSRLEYQPLKNALVEYAGSRQKHALAKLLTPILEAAEKSLWLKQILDSGDIYHPLAWQPAEAHRLLVDVPLLEECGIIVRLPDWWKRRPRPRVGVKIDSRSQTTLDLGSMLSFDVEVAIGDESLTPDEVKYLLAGADNLVSIRGQWVEVDRERLTSALAHWNQLAAANSSGVSFIEGMRLLAGAQFGESGDVSSDAMSEEDLREWSFAHAGDRLREILDRLQEASLVAETVGQCGVKRDGLGMDELEAGRGLNATLRPYQKKGVGWLALLNQLGLGACLADDMGLGKTIQVIALLALLKERGGKGTSLLVIPPSLVGNWRDELKRFAPQLRTTCLHPSELSKEEAESLSRDAAGFVRCHDVVITTYSVLQKYEWLYTEKWAIVVLDEAQAIKNAETKQARAVKKLSGNSRIALTGTPIENRLSDLWSLFDFLLPGLLGSKKKFADFSKRLTTGEKANYAPLRRLVQPYILRRMKTDRSIISDLPDKTEVAAYCSLTKKQVALYQRLVNELSSAMQGADGIKRRGLVLAYLIRFKQLCNHPSQLLGDGAYRASDSGKFERLSELCSEIAARQEKVLVFTQFREMTEPLSEHLAGIFGRQGLILHGSTTIPKRKEMVDSFQRENGQPFFILSLKAGGTGLNLTQASHVIHFDRWWNPAVENQATDRAFRIGQKKNVMVHKFIARGTIEEKIDELIKSKTGLAAELLGGGAEQMLTEMSSEELIKLVSLDIDRAELS